MPDEIKTDAATAVTDAKTAEADAEKVAADAESELPTCPTFASATFTGNLVMSDGSNVPVTITIAPATTGS